MSVDLYNQDKLFNEIVRLANADAEARGTNAAYGGEMGDGGAGRIQDLLEAWIAGRNGLVPKSLKGYQEQAMRELDPEWREYLRLKEKFGG